MKVLSVVGTRPNFIKEISLNLEFRKNGIKEVILHTGQHYDHNMSGQFFDELEIPEPDYIMEILSQRVGARTGKIIEFVEDVLISESPDVCIVMGDVDSTMAGAIAASKLKIPSVHIEAGIRSIDKSNHEEINRRVSDVLADLLLTNCQSALNNLMNEGYSEERVFNTGDLMKDTLDRFLSRVKSPKKTEPYILVTIHRQENSENRHNLQQIVEALVECQQSVCFPIHPRTRKKLLEFDLWESLEKSKHVTLTEPVGYIDFLQLISGAWKVVTDSGGVRREAYMMGVPVINCSTLVWFPEIIECGWKKHTGPNKDAILDAIKHFDPKGPRPEIFGDGKAAKHIVDKIIEFYG